MLKNLTSTPGLSRSDDCDGITMHPNAAIDGNILDAAVRVAQGEWDPGQVLDALPAAVYTTDAEGRITYCNRAAVELSGCTPELGTDKWCVSWRIYRPDGSLLPRDQCPMALALKQRAPVRGFEIVVERPDGTRIPVMPYPTPLHDPIKGFVGAVNLLVDITERRRAEDLVGRRIEEQTALFLFTDHLYRAASLTDVYEAALEAIASTTRCERASILLFDEVGVMRFVAWRGLSEAYREAVEGHSPWKPGDTDPHPIWVPDIDSADEPESLKTIIKAEGIRALSFVPLVTNGAVIGKFMAYYESAHSFSAAERELSLTIARQLGFSIERMRADEQRALLLAELNHRVKNTLATVQSIARQTFRAGDPNEGARQMFDGRLFALAKAHDVLTREHWEGAAISEIIAKATAPFPRDRFETEGPDLRLKPATALGISMALHELCTNAAKYGALSVPDGRAVIRWSSATNERRFLRLHWQERNGPAVSPPTRQGFGTRLLKRSLALELGGEVDLVYEPTGVVCEVRVPL